ncbi:MAG TPA: iron-sulfur cluster repair di-iron protein, partial [Acidobacteriota bacterium]|nr:iron-sulfur cluster repair di-iron protein [Acidobacteriota bacterium]
FSYQALYNGLKAFEADLHQHIHLENNILFPKAKQLEGQVFGKQ